jgi:hypothetical protein
MPLCHFPKRVIIACAALLVAAGFSCAPEYRPFFLGGTGGTGIVAGSAFPGVTGQAFTEVLIQERNFIEGRVVTTITHRIDDLDRIQRLIDFNGDGKIDPVVGYLQGKTGVIQVLLSYGEVGTVEYASLTLDGGDNQWTALLDVAVGDIDRDGALDIVVATREGVVYLHHPTGVERTHVLSEWGQPSGELELIEGTTDTITEEELLVILEQALGPGGDIDNYVVAVEQGYTSIEIADFDGNGYNDIAASRRLEITLQPKPNVPVEPLSIVAGSIQLLLNPGRAVSGEGWTGLTIGTHERHDTLDREGARDLRAHDLDGDGDLDLISTAYDDQNAQVAWFENPGRGGWFDLGAPWIQHRIGSVRGAFTIDVADVTGDGRVDVIATSPLQMQLMLFVQPASVSDRGYDWYTVPIVSFESFEPRSVKAIDLDNDGTLELVVGGTQGAVRYFEPPPLATDEWQGHIILTYDPPGDVGLLGYGDLDADGDADLVAVVSGEDVNADRVTWIRNELIP